MTAAESQTDDRDRHEASPQQRLVVLGASNAARSITTLVEFARLSWGGPVDFLAAIGHGRCYGLKSRVLWRGLPAIDSCGLWEDLSRRPPAPTFGVVTDIGNDLLYGASVSQLISAIESCFDCLQTIGAKTVLTELPLPGIRKLGRAKFLMMRSVLTPRSSVTFADTISRAENLNARLIELARDRNVSIVRPAERWYGIDPIHVKQRHWNDAWGKIFQTFFDRELHVAPRTSWARWLYLRRLRPQRRTWLHRRQVAAQPAGRYDDGTLISFY